MLYEKPIFVLPFLQILKRRNKRPRRASHFTFSRTCHCTFSPPLSCLRILDLRGMWHSSCDGAVGVSPSASKPKPASAAFETSHVAGGDGLMLYLPGMASWHAVSACRPHDGSINVTNHPQYANNTKTTSDAGERLRGFRARAFRETCRSGDIFLGPGGVPVPRWQLAASPSCAWPGCARYDDGRGQA